MFREIGKIRVRTRTSPGKKEDYHLGYINFYTGQERKGR